MAEARIVFGAPVVEEDDARAVVETLRSRWLGPGPQAEALEREFGSFVGAPEALAVSSCTSALHLALLALDLRPGEEVLTSPLTWPATANTIILAGGEPVFVDVREDGTLDPELVARAIGPNTRAILAVHHAGMPADLDALGEVARSHGAVLLQDAAHAIEGRWRGRPLGSYGTAAYSFYATKNMATGEGGMLVSDDHELIARCRLLSQHGVTRNAWHRFADGNLTPYDVVEPGLNYAMADILAALGRSQLRKLPGWHRRRAEIVRAYDDLLTGGPVDLPPRAPAHAVHAHHLYPVLAERREERDDLRRHLHEGGIGTGVHFAPVHLLSWYRDRYGYAPSDLPVAERLGTCGLSLPLTPALRDEDVERISKRVMSW